MMHKAVAGEFQKEVDNTTVLLDDILSILALLEAGDWSEHCTKTELGGRLEREITRLIGDAQEATVTGYELIAEAWRLMDGQDPKTSDWHSKASKYLNSNRVEKVDDVKPKRIRITHIGENGTEIPQFSVGDIFDVHGEEFGEPHITMPSGHVYWLRAMEKYGDKWEVL
ncbi:hypothetical protein HmCmsJML047_01632 [Escherichia coli]|uniref:hypothetical protein n=1 Tax=Escherichia coli TaxID=562 RepID=UPI0010E75057|nr:hypothetical protein [Escherichia coli]GCV65802.1 hypothetical protein HmCmsJML047_01632 [Escherichia coli]